MPIRSVRRSAAAALCFAISSTACAGLLPPSGPDPTRLDIAPAAPANFAVVDPGAVYRGGHPDVAGLAYLQRRGVRTIVDLEIDDGVEATPYDIQDELEGARARGIRVVRLPMSAFEAARSDRFDLLVDRALAVLADPDARPVYVHCKHGEDRTGLVVGLHRVRNEGRAPADAYREMRERGFHPIFVGLDRYFHRKTGWDS